MPQDANNSISSVLHFNQFLLPRLLPVCKIVKLGLLIKVKTLLNLNSFSLVLKKITGLCTPLVICR